MVQIGTRAVSPPGVWGPPNRTVAVRRRPVWWAMLTSPAHYIANHTSSLGQALLCPGSHRRRVWPGGRSSLTPRSTPHRRRRGGRTDVNAL